ncbi:retropepsin-like aspartic protease family protein [Lichenihabitans psoromatis]|uniref:retropepsin-like aspartic protease family protein n=1 Tax=Lichenihabitans psoromatis TaxID=2528642 RepID=UPI0010383AAA|nr:TIGR02281 family clan AA aspartic protease [Lichenihabitans psoromatis]
MNDLTQPEIVSLLFYGALALWLAAAIPRLFRGRFMAGLAALTFWIIAFLVVITGYSYRDELRGVASHVIATVVPGMPMQVSASEVAVMRSSDGQFLVRGTSGDARLSFIFDTGASAVVLRAEDASRLGIKPRELTYDIDVATANGHAMTAETTLPELRIGSIVETDVEVLVAKPGALHENLLGMTFLNRLASFTIADNKLILRSR